MTILASARLRLEPFDDCHVDGLNALNSDEEVMRYITGRAQTREETIEMVDRVKTRWTQCGFSWWSFVELTSGEIVGAGCVQQLRKNQPDPDPAQPLEIGWRLRRDRWHRGLASEAAIVMADFAFKTLQADLICAVCHPDNAASAAVMNRLGMRYRGIESWYEKDLATYEMTPYEWNAKPKPGAASG